MNDISTIEHEINTRVGVSTRDLMTSGLPSSVKALILAVLRNSTSTDPCLILADALDEIAAAIRLDNIEDICWSKAANALREIAVLLAPL